MGPTLNFHHALGGSCELYLAGADSIGRPFWAGHSWCAFPFRDAVRAEEERSYYVRVS